MGEKHRVVFYFFSASHGISKHGTFFGEPWNFEAWHIFVLVAWTHSLARFSRLYPGVLSFSRGLAKTAGRSSR